MAVMQAEVKKHYIWHKFRRNPLAIFGLIILTIIFFSVMLGSFIYQVPIDKIDFSKMSALPSFDHPFGTNSLGQDILARVIFGGRISLTVGILAMFVAIFLGTTIGAIAGFYGGVIDNLLMRLTDLFLALPQLPLLLLVVYLFREPIKQIAGPELGIFILVIIVIGGLNWMSVARLIRGNILKLKEMEFVKAAITLGANSQRIILIHLLPNVVSLIIVAATLGVGNAIITESTLSF